MLRLRTVVYFALCALCGCARDAPTPWQGYAEGEFIALAAPSAGYLRTLDSPRGSRVESGALAFTLDSDPDAQAAGVADAKVAAADARVRNLAAPRRLNEIAALEAGVRAENASLALALADYARIAALAEKRLVALEQLDAARARRDAAEAAVAAAEKTLLTARESLGRTAEVAAARADLAAARAEAEQRHWLLTSKQVTVPTAGEIADTYYRPGEWIAAGAPVVSLLPDARRRIRFFVPEGQLMQLHAGSAVLARCDGCGSAIRGTVDYLSPQAEYTPPVIYSRETRARLVFRVEAAVDLRDAGRLRPGLPLDVVLAP